MDKVSIPQVCFEMLSREIVLKRIPGLESLEHLKLASGGDGGSIKIYTGEKLDKVSLFDLKFGEGVRVPHMGNEVAVGSQLFNVIPDLSYKIPVWGINGTILKNDVFSFDTDFSFGFDLVMDYEFTMKYFEPFNAVYKKYWNYPGFRRVNLDETTTWVRTYISPAFIKVDAPVRMMNVVYDLCSEFIKVWLRIARDAERRDEAFKEQQQKRIASQYAGMRGTDRMSMILEKIYSKDTFSSLYRSSV